MNVLYTRVPNDDDAKHQMSDDQFDRQINSEFMAQAISGMASLAGLPFLPTLAEVDELIASDRPIAVGRHSKIFRITVEEVVLAADGNSSEFR